MPTLTWKESNDEICEEDVVMGLGAVALTAMLLSVTK